MCRNHTVSQIGVLGCISHLHRLEHVTSADQSIGSLAENLLEVIDCEEVSKVVKEVREATKKAKRQKALAKREALLKDMGFKMSPDSGK
eukprot:Awhi_evm1s11055